MRLAIINDVRPGDIIFQNGRQLKITSRKPSNGGWVLHYEEVGGATSGVLVRSATQTVMLKEKKGGGRAD